ncbi:MAG: hypothetical protein AAGH92_10625, partial [Planctomycetota bacterium]
GMKNKPLRRLFRRPPTEPLKLEDLGPLLRREIWPLLRRVPTPLRLENRQLAFEQDRFGMGVITLGKHP